MEWIGIAYEWRKIVIVARHPENSVIVVDFDRALPVKRCSRPHGPGFPSALWLAASPNRGPSIDWEEVTFDAGKMKGENFLEGMVLDPSVPCERSVAAISSDEVRYLLDEGFGSYLWSGGVGVPVPVDAAHGTVLGYEVPADLPKGLASDVNINDSHALVLSLWDNNTGAFHVAVLRKRDKAWRTLPFNGELRPALRGFGRYIAATEDKKKTAQNPRSAGSEEWRKGNRETGPDLAVRMADQDFVMSGTLHLYDVDTEKMFTIVTNQGDSEILLVEGGMVYWRVANRLYSAPIADSGIGAQRLLATGEAIRDAHYAFIKH
jgi:hypothetical protein